MNRQATAVNHLMIIYSCTAIPDTGIRKRQSLPSPVEYYYGGGYTRKEGLVANVDTIFRNLVIVRTKIPFDDIWDISSERINDIS